MDGIHPGKLEKQTNSLLTNKVYRKREKKSTKIDSYYKIKTIDSAKPMATSEMV